MEHKGSISKYCGQSYGSQASKPSHDSNQQRSGPMPVSVNGGRTPAAGNADDLLGGSDGQHYSRSYYAPGVESGMRSVIPRNARVGHDSGGEQQMRVPAVKATVLTEHEYGAGPTPGIVTGDNKGVG